MHFPITISCVLIIRQEKGYGPQIIHEEAQRGQENGAGSHRERNQKHQTHSLFKNIITGSTPCFFNTLQSCSYKCSKKNFGIFAVA